VDEGMAKSRNAISTITFARVNGERRLELIFRREYNKDSIVDAVCCVLMWVEVEMKLLSECPKLEVRF
jgi:hypothetical protein